MVQTKRTPDQTFLDIALVRMLHLSKAAALPPLARAGAIAAIEQTFAPWGEAVVGSEPPSRSNITDDHGPLEFSLALNGSSSEVRILFEAQGVEASRASQWQQGERVNEVLARHCGASLERLLRVQELFRPRSEDVEFAVWHSICVGPDAVPRFKVYLNPQAQGARHAPELVAEALSRLGFGRAAAAVVARRRAQLDELKFFSLDLDRSARARVKVYKVHHAASRADVETELASTGQRPGPAFDGFWNAIARRNGPFCGLPMSTYLSLTLGSDVPTTATLHFPVRSYFQSDGAIYERVRALLDDSDRAIYERALAGFAWRALGAGIGMHSYVSLRHHAGSRRITVYLAPELYSVSQPAGALAS